MFGMKKYTSLSERRKLLSDLSDGAIKMRNTLRCACLPLHETFLSGGEFFEKSAAKIRGGELPRQAVESVLGGYGGLTDEDRYCIFRFARGLDATDRDGQLSNLEIFIKDMEKALSSAETDLLTKGRLYIKGSILTAAAVVLLMI